MRTVPKRGYQFIAPVTRVADPIEAPVSAARFLSRRRPALQLLLLALIVAVAALAIRLLPGRLSGSAPASRIAVVKFDNETGSPEFDRYASALTDSLVAELTSRSGYAIIGNAAVLRQPRSQRDLRLIAASLGAGYVIIGQVQRDRAGQHVLAHLIRMPEQTHVWVSRLDHPPDDPLPAESELARRIAAELHAHLPRNSP